MIKTPTTVPEAPGSRVLAFLTPVQDMQRALLVLQATEQKEHENKQLELLAEHLRHHHQKFMEKHWGRGDYLNAKTNN